MSDRKVSLSEAIATLTSAGAVFSIPDPHQHLSLGAAALRLDVSPKYLREHIDEFAGAWQLPGGEWRIPARDVAALVKRQQERRLVA